MKKPNKTGVVIFTEGETDEIFYKNMINHLLRKFPEKKTVDIIKFVNLKGVGNLKLDKVNSLTGKTGEDKIKSLFKKKNKIYQKGYYVDKFMDDLNFELLYKKLEDKLEPIYNSIFIE